MIKFRTTSALVVALSAIVPNPFMVGDAMAVATASDSIKVSAKVSNPLGVNSATELDFGTFAPNAGGGSFTFNQTTALINSAVLLNTGQLGSVTFTAPIGATFTISIPEFNGASIKIATAGAGGATPSKTMTVQSLKFVTTDTTDGIEFVPGGTTATFSNGNQTTGCKIPAGAADSMANATIGGKLLFNGSQLAATYTGTFTVAITF